MAKELPYYKHEPSEWLEGEIQVCSDAAIVCFTNLCSGYWIKLGCMTYAFALHKYCRKNETIIQELISNGIIDIDGDDIIIRFLDEQLKEFQDISESRRKAANKRWNNANALQKESKSNAIREDKKKEEKKKKDKSIIDRSREFRNSLQPYESKYGKDMIEEFFLYWTEHNPNGKKMRFEMQKIFDVSRRLAKWSQNSKAFINNKKQENDETESERLERLSREIDEEGY